MTRDPADQRPTESVDAELLTLCAEFQQRDVDLMENNAEIKADTTDTLSMDKGEPAAVHARWWEIVDKVIDTPAFTVAGWAAKGSVFPAVLRDLASLDNTTADHRLAPSLTLDMQRHTHPELDADLLAACAAFDAVHAETKAPRGETDADDEILSRAIERWYATLNAVVAIPARTAPGQQAKLRTVYVALEDALHDEPMCGHREEWAALWVLAEFVGASPTLPTEDPEPDAAPAADTQPRRLTEDAELEDYAIFDLETALFNMRADISIVGHMAMSERVVGPEVWRRIEDHLGLACDTLESSWHVAREHRHVLGNALKAERAANKALERARGHQAASRTSSGSRPCGPCCARWRGLRSTLRRGAAACSLITDPCRLTPGRPGSPDNERGAFQPL